MVKVTPWENSTSKIHYNEGSLDFASLPKEGKTTKSVYSQDMLEKNVKQRTQESNYGFW